MTIKTVDANTLKNWLKSSEAILIDVREPSEHQSESIAGSKLIPLSSFDKASLPTSCEGKKIVIHCRKGGRGENACKKLLSELPNVEIYNLEGGIEAWKQSGFEVSSLGKRKLPLDRQVQLVIGILLIASSALGLTHSPLWLIATGIIGAGLTIAGLTGFCGLAMLLARLPYNQKKFCLTPSR